MYKYENEKVIFIVDDSIVIIKLIESYLQNFDDIKICTFSNGEDCIANLSLKPSIVFLDYYFDTEEGNVLNGYDCLTKIKEFDKDIQVIMMSSRTTDDIVCKTTLSGSDGFFVKDNLILEKVNEKVNDSLSIFSLVKKYKRSKIIKRNLYLIILLLISIILKLSI